MQIPRLLKLFIIATLILWLKGCANLAYYAQAVGGHMDVMRRTQPISTIIASPDTDPELKRMLSKVITLREFASRELKLPDNLSYTQYADLQRPYAVWNVVAAPEFSIKLKEWCFIKAGCVSYRGFFSKTKAESYAKKLKDQGYDVHVRGVPAYSTLGWFSDPVLNTFIHSELELARLIFHELAHQVVYVPDDTVFNESFATLVEQEGIRRWLEHNHTTDAYAEYSAKRNRHSKFTMLVYTHRTRLESLFSSDISDVGMRTWKAHIFDDLRQQFALLKTGSADFDSFDRWFLQPLNNARLASVSVYTQLLPAFKALLAQQNGDMQLFFNVVKDISKLSKEERAFALQTAIYENRHSNIAGTF